MLYPGLQGEGLKVCHIKKLVSMNNKSGKEGTETVEMQALGHLALPAATHPSSLIRLRNSSKRRLRNRFASLVMLHV